MNYTDVKYIMDLLESMDGVIAITPANISGFVSHTQSINSDDDIAPGAVNTSDISLTVLDIKSNASLYTGKEFRYCKGYAGDAQRTKLTVPASLYVQRDDLAIYARGKQITVTSGTESQTYTTMETPGALVLKEGVLTVLYPVEPYAEKYSLTGATLIGPTVPDMSSYEHGIAEDYARAGKSYSIGADTVITTQVLTITGTWYLDTLTYEMHDKGLFTADRPKRGTGGQFSITGYDRMTAFDADFLSVFDGVTTESITAAELLTKLCAAADVPLAQQTRHNESVKVAVPEDQESLTGTQILTWLGELMGCSWRINTAGELESIWFAAADTQLTLDDYVSFDYEAFFVAPVDKVMTGSAYAETTGFAGTGANTLVVSENVLLPYTTEEDLQSYSQGILDIASVVPEYRPGTLSGYANPTIRPGDIISVESDDGDMEAVCVTQMAETGFVLNITSSGNQRRETQNFSNLNNTVLKKTVAELQKQVGSFPELWEKSIADTVAAITGAMGGTRVDLFKPGTTQPSGTAYLYDSEDIKTAKKLLVMNAGGIAFYDNGFNVDSHSASVPSFVVMDNQGRVNAAAILVGILTAIRIQSADGKSFWDLGTGRMEMTGNFRTTNGNYMMEMWAAVLALFDGNNMRTRIYTTGTENSIGNVQVFSGSVTEEGGMQPGSRLAQVQPSYIECGADQNGNCDGIIRAGTVNADAGIHAGAEITASKNIVTSQAVCFNAVRPRDGQNTLMTNWKRGTELTANDWVLVGSTIAPYSEVET